MSQLANRASLSGVSNIQRLAGNKQQQKLYSTFSKMNTDVAFHDLAALNKMEAQALDPRLDLDNIYGELNSFSSLLKNKYKSNGFKGYSDRQKMAYLEQIAHKSEVREVLTKMCNELVYTQDDGDYFCDVKINELRLEEYDVDQSTIDMLRDSIKDSFSKIYRKLAFMGSGGWHAAYKYLKQGKLAYVIIWDDPEKPTHILDIIEIDPLSLEEHWDKGNRYWIHKKVSRESLFFNFDYGAKEKIILYDHQVVYVDYRDGHEDLYDMSYLEQLVRPYNLMRIMDETQIIWTVTNSSFRTLYSVPTQDAGKHLAKQIVSSFMNEHKDNYRFDSDSGDIEINGSNNLEFNKDVFMPDGTYGTPNIDTIGGSGPDLQNIEPNEFFARKFYRASGMPYSRFDQGSSESWNLDPQSTYREEIDFTRLVNRMREPFSKVLLKPVLLESAAKFKELRNDPRLAEAVTLQWHSATVFAAQMKQELLKAEFDFVEEMANKLSIQDAEGDDYPFIPVEWLLKEYLQWDDDKLDTIEKYRLKEIEDRFKLARKIEDIKEKYLPADEYGDGFRSMAGDEFDEFGGQDSFDDEASKREEQELARQEKELEQEERRAEKEAERESEEE